MDLQHVSPIPLLKRKEYTLSLPRSSLSSRLHGPGLRKNIIIDDDLCTWPQRRHKRAQDVEHLAICPVVEDKPKIIRIGPNRLLLEEIVDHKLDPITDVRRNGSLPPCNRVGKILDDELELRKPSGYGCAGISDGTSDIDDCAGAVEADRFPCVALSQRLVVGIRPFLKPSDCYFKMLAVFGVRLEEVIDRIGGIETDIKTLFLISVRYTKYLPTAGIVWE